MEDYLRGAKKINLNEIIIRINTNNYAANKKIHCSKRSKILYVRLWGPKKNCVKYFKKSLNRYGTADNILVEISELVL